VIRVHPRSRIKPPAGAILDRSHPLAQGLVAAVPFAWISNAALDASGGLGMPLYAGATWAASWDGPCLYCGASGSGASCTIPPGSAARVQVPLTIGIEVASDGTAAGGYAMVWGVSTTNDSTMDGYRFYMINNTATITATGPGIAGPLNYAIGAGWSAMFAAFTAGSITLVAIPRGGAPNVQTWSGTVNAASYAATAQLAAGAPVGLAAHAAHLYLNWGVIYDRALPVAEMVALAADPYGFYMQSHQMIVPPFQRRTLGGRIGSRGAA
jgi:hypothetical protein